MPSTTPGHGDHEPSGADSPLARTVWSGLRSTAVRRCGWSTKLGVK